MSPEGKALIGSYIASKFASKGKKGWMVGRILSQKAKPDSCDDDSSDVSETDNFNIGYSDGYSLDILLHLDDYCTDVTVNNDIDEGSHASTHPPVEADAGIEGGDAPVREMAGDVLPREPLEPQTSAPCGVNLPLTHLADRTAEHTEG